MIDPGEGGHVRTSLNGFCPTHPSPILRKFLSGLSFFVPFLATTTFEFENFSVLRNFCLDNAPSFFEKIMFCPDFSPGIFPNFDEICPDQDLSSALINRGPALSHIAAKGTKFL